MCYINSALLFTLFFLVPFFYQALCDPLQGFGNAILFVFFSRVLLHRLWSCTCGVFQRLMYYITYPCTQRCLSTPQTPMDTDARSIQSTESTDLLRVTYSPALKRRPLNGDDKKGFSNAHQQLDYGSMQWNPLLNSKENGSLH